MQQSMSLDEFTNLYNEGRPFELVDGEWVAVSPSASRENFTIKRIFLALNAYTEASAFGETFSRTPFVHLDEANFVLASNVPDVMVITGHRWDEYTYQTPDWINRPLLIVPELAVEVVAPDDIYSHIQAKVDGYLRSGVQLVWVADTRRHTVTVYEGGHFSTLRARQVLTGGDLLPDFSMPLPQMFQ